MTLLSPDYAGRLRQVLPADVRGRVVRTSGLTAAVAGFPAPVGALVSIDRQAGTPLAGEVIGFVDDLTLVYLLDSAAGLRHGDRVRLVNTARSIRVGDALLGRVINARGECIDGRPQPALANRVPLDQPAPAATSRPRICAPLSTGVRAIDGMLACGEGQRLGLFAGAGVGKSITLGMIARYTSADVRVVALVGERGREVNEFIERDLGPSLGSSVVVVATSDEPALARVQAALAATSIAEYFRDRGQNVLLLVDSLTRMALAQREIGLAAGEPPATRGFPPSTFALLPRLLERAGRTNSGSITGIYTVLVEGDDPQEPIADSARSLLDGHIFLSRKLAAAGHYPAIDVLDSLSRLMNSIVGEEHAAAALAVRRALATFRDHEDLISVGAYRAGSNLELDRAIRFRAEILDFLRQPIERRSSVEEARAELMRLARRMAEDAV